MTTGMINNTKSEETLGTIRLLRRLGYVALGRSSLVDDGSRVYDEIMSDSTPEWVHRQLFQSKLLSV